MSAGGECSRVYGKRSHRVRAVPNGGEWAAALCVSSITRPLSADQYNLRARAPEQLSETWFALGPICFPKPIDFLRTGLNE